MNKQANIDNTLLSNLCDEYKNNNHMDLSYLERFDVKRGLRNADGSGVMAGITNICNVHGYVMSEGEKIPDTGMLTYRGINVRDIVSGCDRDDRFGYEETAWLLLFGTLPDAQRLERFRELLSKCRELPEFFAEDMIIKAPSVNIMNKLARSVLALYSYDDNPDETTVQNVLRQSITLIAQLPTIMNYAYQVKRRQFDRQSMYFHPLNPAHSTAEMILSSMRPDMHFTHEEARLLDTCLILHAEHGGGNNSTFAARVLSSSCTDTYSAIAAAIGALKGPRHGGANIKTVEMLDYIKAGVKDYGDDEEIAAFLRKIIAKEEGDRSGLIYGMGHAVYTISDPRADILKSRATALAEERGFADDLRLLDAVERLTPGVFAEKKGSAKYICANVDLYSGLVYRILGIPPELYTPIFAVSRMAGWCAHRIEELVWGGRIIRPAYKSTSYPERYLPLNER